MAFEIEYSPDAEGHLRVLTAHERSMVLDEVDVQLTHQPDVETITLSTNPEFLALIARSRARHEKEGGISSQEMRRRLGVELHGG